MTRFLGFAEVLALHRRVILRSGGSQGIRDVRALTSSIEQPRATFGGQDLYPSVVDKASALAFGLVGNHPFVDGNKRVGHAAMEVFLVLNGHELNATVDEQEKIFLSLAAGTLGRRAFKSWLYANVSKTDAP